MESKGVSENLIVSSRNSLAFPDDMCKNGEGEECVVFVDVSKPAALYRTMKWEGLKPVSCTFLRSGDGV